jgi:hypothetical protein
MADAERADNDRRREEMKKPSTIASAIAGKKINELGPLPQGGGLTSFDKTTGEPLAIAAPETAADPDLAIRVHEYGHIILRKLQNGLHAKGFPDSVVQAVLDVNTNQWLLEHGASAVAKLPLEAPLQYGKKDVNLIDRILVAYRSWGLENPPAVKLDPGLKRKIEAVQRIAAYGSTLDHLVRAAQELVILLNQPDAPPPPPKGDESPTKVRIQKGKPDPESKPVDLSQVEEVEIDEESFDEETDSIGLTGADSGEDPGPPPPKSEPSLAVQMALEKISQRHREEENRRLNRRINQKNKTPLWGEKMDPNHPKWMTMKIEKPELQRRLQQVREYGKANKPSYAGPMRFPLRALPGVGDGKVFGSVLRGKRGTVLIDWSGSMSLEHKDLEKLLKEVPRMQVAAYSGRTWDNEGELRILAKHGRMAKPKDVVQYGQANGVDGPALEWLARQPGPRYWICDGHVTGLEDQYSPKLNREALKIAKEHHIRRFDKLQNFFDHKAEID